MRDGLERQADEGPQDLSIHAYITEEEIAKRLGSAAIHLRELAAKVYAGITLTCGSRVMAVAAAVLGTIRTASSSSEISNHHWPGAEAHLRRLAPKLALLRAFGQESTVQFTMDQLHLELAYNTSVNLYIRQHNTHPFSIPFFLLDPDGPPAAYLSSLPQDEAMCQLIDTFRLRMDDEYVFNLESVGFRGGKKTTPLFDEFLDKAGKSGVLPAWWSGKKRKAVKRASQDRGGLRCIYFAMERDDIIDSYEGDVVMPLKLRRLGEKIYGTAVYTD
jgi:hypothetical protein